MEISAENLIGAVRRTVTQSGIFTPGETIVVAVSGGPDSTALLHALATLSVEWNVCLVGAHLNHGFRGAEAEGDAEYVRALCDRLGIPCYCEFVDVPALRQRRHLSAQAAAREVRHAFLRRVAAEVGATRIALGHNRDDRIETVLLNILRGSGLDGLVGLVASEPPLIRPLLDVSRAEIEAYCALHSLHPRHDSSNSKTDYRRNRVRAELLPHLASYYNQCVGDSLLRLSEIAAADTDFLNELAHEALQNVALAQSDAEWVLDATALARLPPALRRRVVRAAIAAVRGDLRDVGMETTERILNALTAERPETVTLPSGETERVEVMVETPTVRIRRLAAPAQALPWRYTLEIPGERDLPRAALVLETRICASLVEASEVEPSGRNTLVYAVQEIALPLTVRSWQPGDRMRPQGLGGTKKLQDLFTDRKIRGEERLRFPVLADAAGRILAVIGLQADERALRLPRAPQTRADSGEYIVLTWR
jgi:tRNA(Ile)-lysidine synthase